MFPRVSPSRTVVKSQKDWFGKALVELLGVVFDMGKTQRA